jgi:hypothetical protein
MHDRTSSQARGREQHPRHCRDRDLQSRRDQIHLSLAAEGGGRALYKFEQDKSLVRPFRVVLDGRAAFSRPVIRRPHATKRGPTKKQKHRKSGPRRSVRRFHGLRLIEVPQRSAVIDRITADLTDLAERSIARARAME